MRKRYIGRGMTVIRGRGRRENKPIVKQRLSIEMREKNSIKVVDVHRRRRKKKTIDAKPEGRMKQMIRDNIL